MLLSFLSCHGTKQLFLCVFSSDLFLSGFPGANVNPGGSVWHKMAQWSCWCGWHWDVAPGTAKGWTLVLLNY